jgi:hypothetical protein
MKPKTIPKSLFLASALLFFLLSCTGQDDPGKQVVGTWVKHLETNTVTLSLSAENKSEVEFNGDDIIDVYGSYEISGTQITFHDEGGEFSSGTSGVYEFTLGDNSITFTKVDDPVDGRSMVVGGTWSKAAEKDN